MVRNLEYVWKISFRISAGAKRDHESPLHDVSPFGHIPSLPRRVGFENIIKVYKNPGKLL